MPFALLIFGLVFVVSAIRGTQADLFTLLREDFTGDKNFFVWVLAIILIVAVGNVRVLRPVSNAFLGLVVLVIILRAGKAGLFESFLSQVKSGTQGENKGFDVGSLFGNLANKSSNAAIMSVMGKIGL